MKKQSPKKLALLQALILTIILFILTAPVSAQWSQANGPEGGAISDVLLDGSDLYAVTTNGGVYKSGDGGSNWSLVGSDIVGDEANSIIKSGSTILVGSDQGAYLTSDAGVNWSFADPGFSFTDISQLLIGGSDIYAATPNGVFISGNDGVNWSGVGLIDLSSDIESVAINGATLWAGTDALYKSTNSGVNWAEVTNVGFTDASINFVCVSGSNTLVQSTAQEGIKYSSDGGTSWNAVTGISEMITAISENGGTLYAGTNGGGIYTSSDDGASWSSFSSTGLDNDIITRVLFDGTTWYAASGGGLYKSTDSGANWAKMVSGMKAHLVNALLTDGTDVYAGTAGGGIFKSTNAGSSWAAVNSGITGKNFSVLSLLQVGADIYAGTAGGVVKTSNNGSSWQQKNTGLSFTFGGRSMVSAGSDLFVIDFLSTIYTSSDGGDNWTVAMGSGGNTFSGLPWSMGSDGVNIYASGFFGDVLMKSSDAGTNWLPANTGITNGGFNVATQFAYDGTSIYAATLEGMYRTDDNATSWVSAGTGLCGLVNAFAVDGSSIYAGTEGSGTYVTSSQGASWTAVNTGLGNQIVASLAAGSLYAGTKGSSVWSYSEPAPGPPNQPLEVTFSSTTTTSATVNWIAPFDNGSAITGYSLEQKEDGGSYSEIYAGTNTSFDVSGLIEGTTYYFKVKATNASGDSPFSNEANFTPSNIIIMADGSTSICSGSFFDTGGIGGNYQNNEDFSFTVSPAIANNKVSVSFTSFSLEDTYDYLYIYDGPTIGDPLLATLTGNTIPSDVVATNAEGVLTFKFTSDGSNVDQGWEATFSCVPPPPSISSFSPTSGPIGTEVIITGTNFDTTPANNILFFGATQATVSAATATELTVTVPTGATYMPITVLVGGLLAYSPDPFVVSFGGEGIDANSFDVKVDLVSWSGGFSVLTSDLDGDGNPDLVMANLFNSNISVFRNISSNGVIETSTFATKVDYTTGSNPISVAIGDLDGDGKPDLVMANSGSATLSVFRNTSTSGIIDANSFATKVDYTTGLGPNSVAISDLDGDGKADIAVTNGSSATVSIFRNTSTSGIIDANSFANKVDYTTGSSPRSVAISDLDGDGKADIAVTNGNSTTVSIFRNISNSGLIDANSFASKIDYTVGSNPGSIAIGDLDGDGRGDLVITHTGVSVLRNTSTSGTIDVNSFASKVDFVTGVGAYSVSMGDLDGDGKLDLAVSNSFDNTVSVLRNTSTIGTIDAGSFAINVDFATDATPRSVSIGDLDGDGKPDLAVSNASFLTLTLYKNIIKNTETDITAFSFIEQTGAASIDAGNHTVDLEVAFGTDVTGLVSTFSLSTGATAEVGATTQVSATTANDFTNPVVYTVTAEDGSTIENWTVVVTIAPSNETDMTAFSLAEQIGAPTIDVVNHTIAIEVTFGTDVIALVPTFTLSTGATAEVGAITQVSATTANDFSNPVTYTILAEDGVSMQDWIITVISPDIPGSGIDSDGDGFYTWYVDSDGDGYGINDTFLSSESTPAAGRSATNDDCDDTNPAINPDIVWYADADSDGFGDVNTTQTSCSQPTGYVASSTDCDDTNASANVNINWYADIDEDGFGDANNVQSNCTQPAGYVANNTDCNDGDSSINPNATDVAGSFIDANCDGNYLWFTDIDGDTYGATQTVSSTNTTPGAGESATADDCDDTDASFNPGASDVPGSGIDLDCQGDYAWYVDADGDGFGSTTVGFTSSAVAGNGTSAVNTDCDDTDETINPDVLWYADTDGDGHGDAANTTTGCTEPTGFVTSSDDCDDTDADVYPAAPALADGKDNDCDGTIDKVSQTITFGALADVEDGSGAITLVASSTSQLAISFAVTGPATVDGATLTLTGAGNVTVTANQVGDDGYLVADEVAQVFCVNPVPEATFTFNGATAVTLTSNYANGNQWFMNDASISGANGQEYDPSQGGLLYVEVDIDGCVGVSNTIDLILTEIENNTFDNSLNIYPMPVSSTLTINTKNLPSGEYTIRMVDITGRYKMNKRISIQENSHKQINVNELPKGTYTLILQHGEDVFVQKVIKK